jgi:serine/threonine protein kinase/formylglycine-generating enzyme required for sulfatase activity
MKVGVILRAMLSGAAMTSEYERSAILQRVCDQFEAAWKSGKEPRIEDYLQQVDECDRTDLLYKLLAVEVDLRLGGGERPSRQVYLDRFPGGASVVEAAFGSCGSVEGVAREPDSASAKESLAEPPSSSATDAQLRRIAASPGPPQEPEAPMGAAVRPIASQADPLRIGRYSVVRRQGEGGFGTVYQAWDEDLKRTVAIKVPHRALFSSSERVELMLNEARLAAQLRHPAIVTVYDVERDPDGNIYLVLEYVNGRPLSDILKTGDFSIEHLIGLMARVADAAHHAHKHGVIHRDLKPTNILVDAEGNPRVADFGLAVHEDMQRLRWGEVAGTMPYMAPEQARGETHRLDGRTDVWTLGVILYRILTGRKPFSGATSELTDEILHRDPKPPRQINDAIPKEIERICLKCLSKRMTDRYNSALDLAEDLRHFQNRTVPAELAGTASLSGFKGARSSPLDHAALLGMEPSDSSGHRVHIVPKGLCAFDESDADFFPELLPGPCDRDGLPDCLRYWKTRIEAADSDKTFRVGLIYGPSGCGKSSLIKAGLLPRLGQRVMPVYVEAAIEETEARLLRGIRKVVPELPDDAGLVMAMALIRHVGFLDPGQKVLIVLDQFEQWLFSRQDLEAAELVAALRQCDGEHLQAICLVRDDFWMAATRFLRELEVELVPDRNVAAVDLFDAKHARKILEAYGRAYDVLPQADDLARDQKAFLDQAIAGLTHEGRVVPVRLALFAEMVKSKPWTPATLNEVGGMDGVGVRFLDESFCSPRSNPTHRLHQHAAQSVLRTLLPQGTTDIKGRMKSVEELRLVSGYSDRPGEFSDLIRVLDRELHLITPVDLAASVDADPSICQPGRGFYQLAHDYLVHSLRNWLTRKQRETRRGCAELLLAERATLWNGKPEDRRLPTFFEWANIRLLTKPKMWTEPERRMMRRAQHVIGLRAAGLTVLAVGLITAALEMHRRSIEATSVTHAAGLVQQLLKADLAEVPGIVQSMNGYRQWIDPTLKQIVSRYPDDSKDKLHASIALLPVDAAQVDYLLSRVFRAGPIEMAVLRQSLRPLRAQLVDRLWRELRGANSSDSPLRARILPVAGLLAQFDPGSDNWSEVDETVAAAAVSTEIGEVTGWLAALWNARRELTDPLVRIFHDKTRPDLPHTVATTFLARYAEDQPEVLLDLLLDAEPTSFSILFPAIERNQSALVDGLKQTVASVADRFQTENVGANPPPEQAVRIRDQRSLRRARAAIALLRLGHPDPAWDVLVHSPEPSTRSFVINGLHGHGLEAAILGAKLQELSGDPAGLTERSASGTRNGYLFDPATSKQRSLIMALAEYPRDALDRSDLARLATLVEGLFHTAPDAGVHSAAELLLSRWGYRDRLKVEAPPPKAGKPLVRRWYKNSQGQTMVLIDGPVEFEMGAPPSDPEREPQEVLHTRKIPRRFAIGSREVTVDDYQRYEADALKRHHKSNEPPLQRRIPQSGVSWFAAAAYFNWLSAKEGLKPCYEADDGSESGAGMKFNAAAAAAGAYRFPTDAEWEYACRAGTNSIRYFGNPVELSRFYEWYAENSGYRPHECGTRLPNDLGLFDMLGNDFEWCHDHRVDQLLKLSGVLVDQIEDERISLEYRCVRSSSFQMNPRPNRSAAGGSFKPLESRPDLGFRPARTIPP